MTKKCMCQHLMAQHNDGVGRCLAKDCYCMEYEKINYNVLKPITSEIYEELNEKLKKEKSEGNLKFKCTRCGETVKGDTQRHMLKLCNKK